MVCLGFCTFKNVILHFFYFIILLLENILYKCVASTIKSPVLINLFNSSFLLFEKMLFSTSLREWMTIDTNWTARRSLTPPISNDKDWRRAEGVENERTPGGSAVRPTSRLVGVDWDQQRTSWLSTRAQRILAPHNSRRHTKQQTRREAAAWRPVSEWVSVAAASVLAAQFGGVAPPPAGWQLS